MKEIQLEDNPEISVIVPMHNAENFVAQTLNSLVCQAFTNFEIIIVDDGSTDNSKALVDKFSFDRRIRYVYKENGGIGSALNVGHELARGKYVTWCKLSNVYYPMFLAVLRASIGMGEKNGTELVYSDFQFIKADGQQIHPVVHNKAQTPKDLISGYDVGMSFLYTKELWDKTGPYWNRPCEDYQWCVRAAQYTKFGLVSAVLAGFLSVPSDTPENDIKEAADDCRSLARALFEPEEAEVCENA